MKTAFVGCLLSCASLLATSTAWGQFFPSTEVGLSISGRNSDGSFSSSVSFTERDEDIDFYSSVGGNRVGNTDRGSATLRASAFAGATFSQQEPGGPLTQVPGLLGVQVAGSAQSTRPFEVGGATGSQIFASAGARARLRDSFSIDTGSVFGTVVVSGYFWLNGTMNVNASATGEQMFSQGNARLSVDSPLFPSVTKVLTSNSATNDFESKFDPLLFSFTTTPGTTNNIDITMVVTGSAAASSPQFAVNGPGFAVADFDVSYQHTLSWGGISEVKNFFTQEPILNWTVTSASGFDYSQVYAAVPEPSTALLLLVGTGLVLVGLRRGNCATRLGLGCDTRSPRAIDITATRTDLSLNESPIG